jgi:hypothetical protein
MSDDLTTLNNMASQIKKYHPTTLVIGAAAGAAVGLASAYLLTRKFAEDESVQVSPAEAIKLGVLVFGLLRSIATL